MFLTKVGAGRACKGICNRWAADFNLVGCILGLYEILGMKISSGVPRHSLWSKYFVAD